ncbi:TatD family hydrolase [Paenibacillus validus]|uniref:Aryldialkylphosphatase n=1 Tax=Paenibacillus validus TaxID=44253 RepID=A0A7X3CTA2_9BACL|nr:TatD family hydrolase [Paenibacillus validus]MED4599222.1 TatD family hydrolase [Paenibacillus validus]MED4606471.1 TatD family hydrolase [Paenibacillus validus]MUG71531.1 hypothetical protein [Paenibacillus validus]
MKDVVRLAIHTVLGPIHNEQLGFCHSHEHLFIADGQPARVNAALRIDDIALTIQELLLFKEVGGRSLVDAQPLGCGRMEKSLVLAAQETDTHIVASTGFHKMIFYPSEHWIHTYDEAALYEVFVHELTVGMYTGTDRGEPNDFIDAQAGVIKTAIDEERIQDPEKKWFRAAARAAVETGAPLLCHTESCVQAVQLVDLYRTEGVPANQIIVCHLDRNLGQLEIHKQLADLGVYLEYDTIGRYKYHSDEEEADLIRHMVESGYEDLILLGLDTTRHRLRSYGGTIGLDHLSRRFLPLLQQYGVPEAAVRKMMVHNPAQAFDIK